MTWKNQEVHRSQCFRKTYLKIPAVFHVFDLLVQNLDCCKKSFLSFCAESFKCPQLFVFDFPGLLRLLIHSFGQLDYNAPDASSRPIGPKVTCLEGSLHTY